MATNGRESGDPRLLLGLTLALAKVVGLADRWRLGGQPIDEAEAAWNAAWNAAIKIISSTMAEEDIVRLNEEMLIHDHADLLRPWGRVWGAMDSRIVDKVGVAPGHPPRRPDSLLALPHEVVEVHLRGATNLTPGALRCVACGYLLPSAGENVAIERDDDGAWHDRATREPCSAPIYPTDTERRGRYRVIELFPRGCPLCAGDELVSAVNDRAPQEARV